MLLEAEALRKTYDRGATSVEALRGVSLRIDKGDFVAIVGPSGSGKSTLLHVVGALDRPSAGTVTIGGEAIHAYSDARLAAFRRRKLGFVFQFFHLLPTLTAEENVVLPLILDGMSPSSVLGKARELLRELGLEGRAGHRPDQLSGGEMQRVALARALVTDPLLVLADEPTGNLDTRSGTTVLEMLRALVKGRGLALLMVTHDHAAARAADRVVALRDGSIVADGSPDEVLGAAGLHD
jgi:putative ABC transport system ATP-binding protein